MIDWWDWAPTARIMHERSRAGFEKRPDVVRREAGIPALRSFLHAITEAAGL